MSYGMTVRVRSGVAALVAAALLASCSVGLDRLPAPAGTSGPVYHVTANFTDVQSLTVGAQVKLGGVVVGEVTRITTADYLAAVHMNIEKKFALGRDAELQIRFTTPLGEDFVSITSAGHVAQDALPDGATVPVGQTQTAPSIEDTFAALSTLLNGGGLSKLQTIAAELDAAFKGRTSDARDALIQLDKVIANLDDHKVDIDSVLDGLGRLAKTLNSGTGEVDEALDLFPSTLSALADDTGEIRVLLQHVATLGTTVSGLLRRSQSAMLTDFDNLRPTLDSLRARENQLVPTFDSLITLGQAIDRAAPGDYLNVSGTIQFLLENTGAKPKAGGTVRAGAEPSSDAVTQLLGGGLPQ
jgi:phospholipid/cholesterol/gamma-HCH transport system substrate-binding protein